MDTLTNWRRRAEKLYLGYAGRRAASRVDAPVEQPPAEGEIFITHDGVRLLLRDIHPNDVQALQRGFAGLTPEEIRFRFLHPLTELPEALARRLCEIDPQNAVALVLIDRPDTREPEIHAVARAFIDPVTLSAEFAIIVQHRFAGQGVGTLLMQRLIEACRKLRVAELWGDVLAENGAMLELCENLGFSRRAVFQDPGVVRVTLLL